MLISKGAGGRVLFYYENNKILFSVIQDLYLNKVPIDSMTVTTELKNRKILQKHQLSKSKYRSFWSKQARFKFLSKK